MAVDNEGFTERMVEAGGIESVRRFGQFRTLLDNHGRNLHTFGHLRLRRFCYSVRSGPVLVSS